MWLLEEQVAWVLDGIDEVGDRVSEGQAAGVYVAGFAEIVQGVQCCFRQGVDRCQEGGRM